MKTFTAALALAMTFALFGTSVTNACGGMDTVNPPPLTMEDPDSPSYTSGDDLKLTEGECIV